MTTRPIGAESDKISHRLRWHFSLKTHSRRASTLKKSYMNFFHRPFEICHRPFYHSTNDTRARAVQGKEGRLALIHHGDLRGQAAETNLNHSIFMYMTCMIKAAQFIARYLLQGRYMRMQYDYDREMRSIIVCASLFENTKTYWNFKQKPFSKT